jgi:hypothetical protein
LDPWEVDRAGEEERQIEKVWNAADARRKRGERAVERLEWLRVQMLELELKFGRNASWEERAGNYDLADAYRRAKVAIRQMRDGQPSQDLVSDLSHAVKDVKP